MINGKKIGLSLSGGGFRAAAFHLGALKRLKSMGILDHVDVISTISGGSIIGAYYGLNKNDFKDFEINFRKCLKKGMMLRMIFSLRLILFYVGFLACICGICILYIKGNLWYLGSMSIIVMLSLIFIFQFKLLAFTKAKEIAFEKIFFKNKTISDLPLSPIFAINATNLETGTLFTFSQTKIDDSSYHYPRNGGLKISFKGEAIPISLAVNSSTNVPFPFGPVGIRAKYFKTLEMSKEVKPALMDGGLYDNQGIHKITQLKSSYNCNVIICCDGSQPFSYSFKTKNSIGLLRRTSDIMMRRIKNLQFVRNVYENKQEIAYYSLDWTYEKCLGSFVTKAVNGELSNELLSFHNIDIQCWLDKKDCISNITEIVKTRIGFDQLIKEGLSDEEVLEMSKIKTGLASFSEDRIEKLARHGSVLTGIQVSLYCPSLKNNNYEI
ncbi:patatin-like phospholipase family protein [Edaphocola aurantiacus]|uniref:patatin-like phospholipase family protein n=1 Tax=Edaphocola aurantiacus TaxID=2601682 RepID=UPI001C97FAD3|nr:patatin-like phospholipase family protein [Edaphocola aurantiacus]